MNRFCLLLVILLFSMMPQKGNCDDFKGGFTIDGGKFSLGQSHWKYENGNFIVYGGESGGERKKNFYMLFSNLPFGSFEAFDYAPNLKNETGSFEILINNKITTYRFQKNKTLLVFLSDKKDLCHDYIKLSSKEWKEFMQPYANSINNDEYYTIRNYFITKTTNCR